MIERFMVSKYKVTFLPEGIEANIPEGTSLMQAAADAGIQMEGPCGGKGTCGKCRVLIKEEKTEKPVLACKTLVQEDMTVIIPLSEVTLLRKGENDTHDLGIRIMPGIWKKSLTVAEPELRTQKSDLTRLYEAFGQVLPLTYTALKSLPQVLRPGRNPVTAVYTDDQILSLEEGNTENQLFGLAVDIGTTTVVAALMDLITGNVLGVASTTNSQNIFGSDVVSRIEHVINNPQGLEQLQWRSVQVVNTLIDELCSKADILPVNIYRVTIAGNTTMEHLFLGIDPRNLAPAPFIPVMTHPIELEAREIGLQINSHGRIHLIPNIAGYVGGDTTSVILATQVYDKPGIYLVIDIGTNGEVVLSVDGKMHACSTAAGPAFEGAHIKHGMRAAPGAIEGVVFNGDIFLKVIGNISPSGICGSGLLQAVQVMLLIGVVTPSGKLITRKEGENMCLSPSVLERLGSDKNGNYFILSYPENNREAVVITQNDVRELQLAKGAIRTGIEVLFKEAGITASDVNQVLLAGAFGNYLDKESAVFLGLIPDIPSERIKSIGNAAGTGARMALISDPLLRSASVISKNVKHIELSGRQDFYEMFIRYMGFDQT
ncbi:MAG: DUF4445 domain-containing protein [Peptococcaceae bacterium]|nr:DUF4445 domain-containing protein [Peptococcaceae bacterium]